MPIYLILAPLLLGAPAEPPGRPVGGPRLPLLKNDAAWRRLPDAPESPRPLPAWARALAGPLPVTTARMIELDALHRSGDRLDARLRALARWAAADANGCGYAKTVAAADLARTGTTDDIEVLVKNPARLPAFDRAAVGFARKMMTEAYSVTDEEVKDLIGLAGEERVVALVALVAHASFQDRVLLALNLDAEARDDPPPLPVRFGRPEPRPPADSATQKDTPPGAAAGGLAESHWLELRRNLEKQRERASRIRVPSREAVLKRLGQGHPSAWQAGIVWSRVCFGYQPELTQAWFDCAAAFRNESRLDRLFQNAIFWVVTESLQCFY